MSSTPTEACLALLGQIQGAVEADSIKTSLAEYIFVNLEQSKRQTAADSKTEAAVPVQACNSVSANHSLAATPAIVADVGDDE